MSLPAPAPRRHMHTRAIRFEAYEREDGLWDIEGFMVDTKTYAVKEPYRGHRPAGAHVHDMALRLTLDEKMVVRDIEVSTAHAPYEPCFTVGPAFKALVGAQIGSGWRKAINAAVGGVKGCTHLKELMISAATVAYQAMGRWPREADVPVADKPATPAEKPYFLDGCRAWDTSGEVTRRLYPLHFRPKA